MKIAVIDDSKIFLKYLKQQLNKLGFDNNYFFTNHIELIEWSEKNQDVDVFFIDYHMPETDGISLLKILKEKTPHAYFVLITSDQNPELKNMALEKGFNSFLPKNFSQPDLKAKLQTVKNLRNYIKKELIKQEQFKKLLQIKANQEKIAHQKQSKIMKNQLEMFFDNDLLFEIYFNPLDLLTGDTIYTKKMGEKSYLLAIIDAMGKGIGASLTAFNTIAFFKHSIKKALEYQDFNFEKLVKDFVEYAKSILLTNEILCANIVYIQGNEVTYANFGNPMIYYDDKKVIANNYPIREATSEINIDKFAFKEKMLLCSDGLLEAKTEKSFYLTRLKNIFPKSVFLKDILKDYEQNAQQSDDLSIIYIRKENFDMQKVFSEKITLNFKSVDNFLLKFCSLDVPKKEKLHLMLHEILLNTLEHGIKKIDNKEKLRKEKKLKVNDIDVKHYYANISIYKNDEYIKLEYEDNTEGFEIQKIKDAYYDNYHGRGIKIIKKMSEAIFFSENGSKIKIFLKG